MFYLKNALNRRGPKPTVTREHVTLIISPREGTHRGDKLSSMATRRTYQHVVADQRDCERLSTYGHTKVYHVLRKNCRQIVYVGQDYQR
jgi:hypothetical protein